MTFSFHTSQAFSNLELSYGKNLLANINEGFDFPCWNFRKYNGKLLIKPSKKSIKRFTETISQTIKKGMAWSQEVLIAKLNPIIKGWTNYHNSVVSQDAFQILDPRIWELLWKWAKRRHSNKSEDRIFNKSWKRSTSRRWNFRTERNGLLLLSKTRKGSQSFECDDPKKDSVPKFSDERKIKKSLDFVIGYNLCNYTSGLKSLDIEC